MAPVIRISENLYEKLARHAEGFDKPENVITKLLQTYESSHPQKKESPIPLFPEEKSKGQITDEYIEACCTYGKLVCNEMCKIQDAKEKIGKMGMNKSSAYMYLTAYRSMRHGEVFKRNISSKAMSFFLDHIRLKHGSAGLEKAIRSAELNVDYLRKKCGNHCRSTRRVIENFKEKLRKQAG